MIRLANENVVVRVNDISRTRKGHTTMLRSGENNMTAVRPHRAQSALWPDERSIAMAAYLVDFCNRLQESILPKMISLYWRTVRKPGLLDRDMR